MTEKEQGQPDEIPPTPLAGLVAVAKEKLAPKIDRHGPIAVKTLAAIVRDLTGMPNLIVTRESGARLRLARKGKVGHVVVDYDAAVLMMEVTLGGFSELEEPMAQKTQRYTLNNDTWTRMDGGGDLFGDLRAHVLRLYPELADGT